MKAKKLILAAVCTATLFSMTACGDTASTEGTSETVTTDSTELPETDETNENAQIPNPWTDCEDMKEAEEHAGFALDAPETIDKYASRTIQVLDKEIIQVIYQENADAEESIVIRKGTGTEDISGDYTEYAESNQVTVGDVQVTEKGENGKVSLATWTSGDYSYSVSVPGMSHEEVSSIIEQVKQEQIKNFDRVDLVELKIYAPGECNPAEIDVYHHVPLRFCSPGAFLFHCHNNGKFVVGI